VLGNPFSERSLIYISGGIIALKGLF